MKIHHCLQHHADGTPGAEWLQAHVGRVSGSAMAAVLDFTKNGVQGAKRRTYSREKLAERLTGIITSDRYVSREMTEGIEREPLGRAAYESQEGVMVEQIGYAEHDEIENFIVSPDGLVGDDGGLELKCPKPGTHLDWILGGCIPQEHLPQLRAFLAVTRRKWVDFCSFCPFVPKPLQLMVIRFEWSQADVLALEGAVEGFNFQIDLAIQKLRDTVGDFDLPAASAPEEEKEDDTPPEAWLTDEDFAGLK
jgi:hypothetical protein